MFLVFFALFFILRECNYLNLGRYIVQWRSTEDCQRQDVTTITLQADTMKTHYVKIKKKIYYNGKSWNILCFYVGFRHGLVNKIRQTFTYFQTFVSIRSVCREFRRLNLVTRLSQAPVTVLTSARHNWKPRSTVQIIRHFDFVCSLCRNV